ncbi:MAG: carboxymuconolactone decarboxylase family protein [Gammaproteobacteria bacterium]
MENFNKPRIPPLAETEWSDEQRELLNYAYREGGFYNVIGTLARHWDASKALGAMGSHVLGPTSRLSGRDRELLILRTAWLCQAEYEWAQHVHIGLKAGLGRDEIERVQRGPEDPDWEAFDATLIRAADELHSRQCVSDRTWAQLSAVYDQLQLMDVVFAVGQYTLVAMALKSFGTPLDKGLEGY